MLLDTHAWLWWHACPERLSERARKRWRRPIASV